MFHYYFFFFFLLQAEDVVGCHVEDAITFWAQVSLKKKVILDLRITSAVSFKTEINHFSKKSEIIVCPSV